MYKNETDPKCLLCAKEEENIEHFILNCKSLSKVRNTILQKIIRERPFNSKGGGYFFFLKKYSDFGGGKKKI
jgi:hypothetical protein